MSASTPAPDDRPGTTAPDDPAPSAADHGTPPRSPGDQPQRHRPIRRGARAIRDAEHQHLDQFGAVLLLAVLTISGLTLFDLYGENADNGSTITATALSLVVGLTMMLALRASGVKQRTRRFANIFLVLGWLLSIVVMIITLTSDVDVGNLDERRPSILWVVIALLTPVYIVRRLLQHRRVTVQTMLGAIAAYLMIAVGYAYLYLFVADVGSRDFFTDPEAAETSTSFAYFSLVTITTLGYGDLSPATNLGRLLSTSEAIIGQVYLVTFVAMFVGIFIDQRGKDDSGATVDTAVTDDQASEGAADPAAD